MWPMEDGRRGEQTHQQRSVERWQVDGVFQTWARTNNWVELHGSRRGSDSGIGPESVTFRLFTEPSEPYDDYRLLCLPETTP